MSRHALRTALSLVLALFLAPAASGAIVVFTANLTGSQEVPANASTASGFGTFVLNDAQTALTMDVTVFGLDFTGTQTPNNLNDDLVNAHIHAGTGTGVGSGLPGFNAGVRWGFIGTPFNDTVIPNVVVTPFVNGVGGRVIGTWDQLEGNGTTLTAQLPNILAGQSYINFHTTQFPGGEIRGQLVAAPLPASLAIWGLGAVGVGYVVRRRKRVAA
jgi:hypothetical protein